MAYLGNAPARSFISFERQVFTIVNSQTAYTLDHSVNNENDIRLVINNIVQEPGSGKAYTASGTTLTLSAALVNGTDEMYCVFLGRATATNAPGGGSVNTAAITDLNVTTAKIAADAITEAKIADDAVESEHLNDNVISGQTELAAEPADTDEFLVSDAGSLKRIDYSYIKASGGMTLLNSGSVSSTTSQLSFDTTYVTTTHRHYRLLMSGKVTDDNTGIRMRYKNEAASAAITSPYSYNVTDIGVNDSYTKQTSVNRIEITNQHYLGNNTNEGFNLILDFMSPLSNTVPTMAQWQIGGANNSDAFTFQFGAARRNDGTEKHGGFLLYMTSGDFAEYTYEFYGYNK